MIFPENRFPPRIKSGAGFFGIMLYPFDPAAGGGAGANWPGGGAGAKVGCALAGVIGCGPPAVGGIFVVDFAAAFGSDGAGFFFAVFALPAAVRGS